MLSEEIMTDRRRQRLKELHATFPYRKFVPSEHEALHAVFNVEGGGQHDHLVNAINEARDIGTKVGDPDDPQIKLTWEDRPVQRVSRANKLGGKATGSKR